MRITSVVCTHKIYKTYTWCCRGAATLGQLGYAGLHSGGCCHSGQLQEDGCLGPDDGVTGSKVHRVGMGSGASSHGLASDATLAQDNNCGYSLQFFIVVSFCVVMVAAEWNGNEDAEVEILSGGWNTEWEFSLKRNRYPAVGSLLESEMSH